MTPPAHATLRLMVASVDPRIADDLRHAFGLLGEDIEIIHAADAIGIRGMVVHALSEEAKAFYQRLGLDASPLDPMTLMVTVIDLREAVKA